MTEDNSFLWFLVRNPRAYNEVVDWLETKRQKLKKTNIYLEKKAQTCIIHRTMWLQGCAQIDLIDELLNDLKKEIALNFSPSLKQHSIKEDK